LKIWPLSLNGRMNRPSLTKTYWLAIIDAVESLTENPRKQGVRKLVGSDHTYRLRIGNYRVVYEIIDDILFIEIVRVKHRKDVYR